MEHSTLALFIPFAAEGEPWVVRRAHTVVESWPTKNEAIMAAFRLATDLCERMGSEVSIEMQDAEGDWHMLSPVRRRARTFAALQKGAAPDDKRRA